MHPFKKLCKHARKEIDNKGAYSQGERDAADGKCWKCDGPLTEAFRLPFEKVSMDEETRQFLANNPKKLAEIKERHNQPRYECVPCFELMLKEREKGLFIPLEELRQQALDRNWKAELIELIKEVEVCGSDCPYWNRLTLWKKNLESLYS